MSGPLSQVGLLWSLGLAVAVLMIRIGVTKRALDVRHPSRPCASCGRTYRGRACPRCGRA